MSVIELTSAQEFFDFIEDYEVVVVEFARRHGCIPCNRLAPHFKMASDRFDDVPFGAVYLDEIKPEDMFTLVDEFGLLSTPTVLMFRGSLKTELLGRTAPVLINEIGTLTERNV